MPIARRLPIQIPVWEFNGFTDNNMPDYVKYEEWFFWDDGPILRITNPGISSDVLTARVGFYISQDASNGKVYPIDPEMFAKTYILLPWSGKGPLMAQKIVGDNEFWRFKGYPDWLMPPWVDYSGWQDTEECVLAVPTNEGSSDAQPGDVIMRGPMGEVYPMPYGIFKERYKVLYFKSALHILKDTLTG